MTVDDVVEVIQEETEEDLRRLAGVGDESLADSVVNTVRNRIQWLALNLVTAMLSASVIKLFDASIEQMVALAVLMPIVASMGGNAATQTMAVAVRALATRELGRVNARRVILREASVGLINGVVLAALLALVVYLVFGRGTLGIVIAAAMIFNLFAAALAGILIPLALDRLGLRPGGGFGRVRHDRHRCRRLLRLPWAGDAVSALMTRRILEEYHDRSRPPPRSQRQGGVAAFVQGLHRVLQVHRCPTT